MRERFVEENDESAKPPPECDELTDPMNGTIYYRNNTAFFECEEGYIITGERTLECNSTYLSSNWSGIPPSCIRADGESETDSESDDHAGIAVGIAVGVVVIVTVAGVAIFFIFCRESSNDYVTQSDNRARPTIERIDGDGTISPDLAAGEGRVNKPQSVYVVSDGAMDADISSVPCLEEAEEFQEEYSLVQRPYDVDDNEEEAIGDVYDTGTSPGLPPPPCDEHEPSRDEQQSPLDAYGHPLEPPPRRRQTNESTRTTSYVTPNPAVNCDEDPIEEDIYDWANQSSLQGANSVDDDDDGIVKPESFRKINIRELLLPKYTKVNRESSGAIEVDGVYLSPV